MWLVCSMSRDSLTVREASLEQMTDALGNDGGRLLVESARVEALMERCRRNLVIDRETSSFLGLVNDATCLRVDYSRELWVSHHGVARLSHLLRFPLLVCSTAGFSLEREAALPVSSQSTPPSGRVSKLMVFSWVIDEPVRDMLGRAVFVTENDVYLGDMGVHSRPDGSRVRMSQVADEDLSIGVNVGFTHTERSLAT